MNSPMNTNETAARLTELVTVEFLDLHVPDMAHIETMPYALVLDELARHVGDCQRCFDDGDGPTTCEESEVLEFAGRYMIEEQFITSLLN
jgi:hypothetical protein